MDTSRDIDAITRVYAPETTVLPCQKPEVITDRIDLPIVSGITTHYSWEGDVLYLPERCSIAEGKVPPL
jgi:hypothetical protein